MSLTYVCVHFWVHICLCVFLQGRVQLENGALTISSLTLSDGGMYQCVAENKYGIIYASAELVVLGKLMQRNPEKNSLFSQCMYIFSVLCTVRNWHNFFTGTY